MTEHVRTFKQVWEDGLYPGSPMCPDPEVEGIRYMAVAEVLCRLPEEAYAKVAEAIYTFQWFIPDPNMRGMVLPFPANIYPRKRKGRLALAPYARVVYLAPHLEHGTLGVAVLTVVHELAHIVLGHSLINGPDDYDRQEEEVFEVVCSWGFEKEARAHRRVCRARETRQRNLVSRLLAEEQRR